MCIHVQRSDGVAHSERMEERNYINYIYRVKQLCHCKKTDSFFFFSPKKKKKSYVFRNWEYREIFILRLLCYILAQSSPADFNPFKCLKMAGSIPPDPSCTIFNFKITSLFLSYGSHLIAKLDCASHFVTREEFNNCGIFVLRLTSVERRTLGCSRVRVCSRGPSPKTSLHILTEVYPSPLSSHVE